MLLNYNHLHYFHVAAVEGSVAGAAQRLGVRQPTVSEQIRALETALGRELFERTQAGLRLTEAGRLAFVETSRMFVAGKRIAELVARDACPEPRILRIGVSNIIDRATKHELLMALVIGGDYVPSIRTAETVDVLRDLRAGALDLVLCELEPADDMRRGLAIELVDRPELVAVAPPALQPNAKWTNVGIASFRPTSPYWRDIGAYLSEHHLGPRVIAEADDPMFLVAVAVRVPCVAIVPRSAARRALEDGSVRLLAEVQSSALAIHALYHDNTLARRAIALLARTS